MYILDQYRGTVLACRYAIPPRLAPAELRTQLEEAVKVAVVGVVMRHPMLQVGMMDVTSKTPSWIQLQNLDLTKHLTWHYIEDNDDFDQTVQETFRIKLDERFADFSIKQPGWWITVIRQGNNPTMEVLLTWDQSQFDAIGAKVFHEDLTEMLNAEKGAYERNDLDGNILKLPQPAALLPIPIESLTSLPVDVKFLIKSVWEEVRPRFLNRDASQAAWCPIRSSPYKTQYRFFCIDQTSLRAVLALCRKNKTTITALIHGLALIAFSSHLNAKAAPAFQSSTIMDHRRNLPSAPKDVPWVSYDRAVANYVTQAFHKYDARLVKRIRAKLASNAGEGKELSADLQRELWAVSARSRREIVGRLEAGLQNDLVGVFKYVTDWQQTMSDLANRKRQLSWLVTNIGVMDGSASKGKSKTTTQSPTNGDTKPADEVQKWSIERAQFGLSAEIPAAAIEFAVVSAAGGGMCVSATWPDCAVDSTLGQRIMADMERWLKQLAGPS